MNQNNIEYIIRIPDGQIELSDYIGYYVIKLSDITDIDIRDIVDKTGKYVPKFYGILIENNIIRRKNYIFCDRGSYYRTLREYNNNGVIYYSTATVFKSKIGIDFIYDFTEDNLKLIDSL